MTKEKLPKLFMKPNIKQRGLEFTKDGTITIPLEVLLIGKFHGLTKFSKSDAEEFAEWAMELSKEALEDLTVEIAYEFNKKVEALGEDSKW